MALSWDPGRWGDPAVEAASRRLLDSGLSEARSVLDPTVTAWTAEIAEKLRRRVTDDTAAGDTFLGRLNNQIAGASDAELLLCAEMLFLHSVPLTNVGTEAKHARINTVLAHLSSPRTSPDDWEKALLANGVFNGGTGFNVQIWRQLDWLLSFLEHWTSQPQTVRTSALTDPWAFRSIVASIQLDQPGIRNSLLYLAFPKTFFPIVNQTHKSRIRDAFASVIGGSTGNDAVAIDRDLLAIRQKQTEHTGGALVNYYSEPYVSQWMKPTDAGQRAWLMRAADSAPGVGEWTADEVVSLPAAHLVDLAPGADLPTVRTAVEAGYQHEEYVRRLALATEFHAFLTRMKVDDIAVAVQDGQAYVGVITGDARYATDGTGTSLSRAVAWSQHPTATTALEAPVPALLDQQGAVVDLTAAFEIFRRLLPADATPEPTPSTPQSEPADVQLPRVPRELSAELHVDHGWLQRLADLIQDRRQVILYGPPGTGKTYLAQALARSLGGRERTSLVQFHPSYAYEDFFEGYRPVPGEAGSLSFDLRPGPLREVAASARSRPGDPYFLVIDEINRANLPKVFGELYYLLEYRGDAVRLQYSPTEAFTLPPNLFIIGTMNTADRSIALIDAALRRRFAFVELHPDHTPTSELLARWLADNDRVGDERPELLAALNLEIGEVDRDFQIGPSYLMTADADRGGGMDRIWEFSILPLLEEHYYGRYTRAEVHRRFGLAKLRKDIATNSAPPTNAGTGTGSPTEPVIGTS